MLEYLYLARGDEAYDVLSAGYLPLFGRLLTLNAVFLALLGLRKLAGARPMSFGMVLFLPLVVVGANLFIIYQPQAMDYFQSVTSRWF